LLAELERSVDRNFPLGAHRLRRAIRRAEPMRDNLAGCVTSAVTRMATRRAM
jgi:hypothetical protein